MNVSEEYKPVHEEPESEQVSEGENIACKPDHIVYTAEMLWPGVKCDYFDLNKCIVKDMIPCKCDPESVISIARFYFSPRFIGDKLSPITWGRLFKGNRDFYIFPRPIIKEFLTLLFNEVEIVFLKMMIEYSNLTDGYLSNCVIYGDDVNLLRRYLLVKELETEYIIENCNFYGSYNILREIITEGFKFCTNHFNGFCSSFTAHRSYVKKIIEENLVPIDVINSYDFINYYVEALQDLVFLSKYVKDSNGEFLISKCAAKSCASQFDELVYFKDVDGDSLQIKYIREIVSLNYFNFPKFTDFFWKYLIKMENLESLNREIDSCSILDLLKEDSYYLMKTKPPIHFCSYILCCPR